MSQPNIDDLQNGKNLVYKSHLYAKRDIIVGDITISPKRLVFHRGFEQPKELVISRSFYRLNKSSEKSGLIDRKIEVDDIFDKLKIERRIVLLGEAGLGKSLELKKIAFLLNQKYNLPVALISLKNIEQVSTIPLFQLTPEQIDVTGEGVLLIDGLDEVSIESARKSIKDIAEGFPLLRIVVTCRANIYSGQLGDFSEVFISKFSAAQIDQFLIQKIGNEKKEHFNQAIPSQDFHEILQIPFYLEKAANYFLENDFTLPKSKTELLEYFILESLDIRLKSSSVLESNEQLKSVCLKQLRKVAFVAECMGQNQLTIREFRELVEQDEELELVFNQSSLINRDSNSIQYTHRILQEFLAAQTLAQFKNLRSIRKVICSDLGYQVVKKSWNNTLSYLWELKKDDTKFCHNFINWLLKNNPTVILSFEGLGVTNEVKIAVIQRILDFLHEAGITFDYQQYNPVKVASFCQSDSVFKLLMERFLSSQDNHDKANVLKILAYFSPSYAVLDINGKLRDLLFQKIHTSSEPYTRHLATDVIIRFYQNAKPEEAQKVAKLYFNSEQSSYDRNCAYRFINGGKIHADWFELLLRRLIEIEEDRFSTGLTLSDELLFLEECIHGVSQKECVLTYFELYQPIFRDGSQYHGKVFFKEFMDKVLLMPLTENEQDRVFTSISKILLDSLILDLHQVIPDCIRFIEVASKQREFIIYCLTRAAEYPQQLITHFLTVEEFSQIVDAFEDKSIDERWINILISHLHYKDVAIEEGFVTAINDQIRTNFQVRRGPKLPTESVEEKQKRILTENLNLLFSKDDFMQAVSSLFIALDIVKLNSKKVHSIAYEKGREFYKDFTNQYLEVVIRLVNAYPNATKEEILESLDKSWNWYSVREIQARLRRYSGYELKPDQREYIIEWCDQHAPTVSLIDEITKRDQAFFFYLSFLQLRHYSPDLYIQGIRYGMMAARSGKENLLHLSNEIEGVDLDSIKLAIREGIASKTIRNYALSQALDFIGTHQYQDFPPVLFQLIRDKEEHYRIHALKTYVLCKGDTKPLLDILNKTSPEDDFEAYLLDALWDSEPDGIKHILLQRFNSTVDRHMKLRYAKYLCRFSYSQALKYILEYTRAEKKSPFAEDWPGNERILSNTISAIPLLLKLYAQGFDSHMDQSPISMIQSRVRSTLRHLALSEDRKNFKRVIRKLRFWLWTQKKLGKLFVKLRLTTATTVEAAKSMNYFVSDLESNYHYQQRMSLEEARKAYRDFA